jgi:hypothetical protein
MNVLDAVWNSRGSTLTRTIATVAAAPLQLFVIGTRAGGRRFKRPGQKMQICIAILIALALSACSAESIRQGNKPDLAPMSRDAERDHIRQEGQNFCANYPDDAACRGPKR